MPKPEGKHIFGTVKVGQKGQIVIPKAARDVFKIKPGDSLLVLGDEKQGGIALTKSNIFLDAIAKIMGDRSAKEIEKIIANDILTSEDSSQDEKDYANGILDKKDKGEENK